MDPEEKKNLLGKSEDVYHFVAYVPFRGYGVRTRWIEARTDPLGDAGADWWNVAKPAIEARMARHEDITSCLLSVCRSKIARLEEQMSELVAGGNQNEAELASLQAEVEAEITKKATGTGECTQTAQFHTLCCITIHCIDEKESS